MTLFARSGTVSQTKTRWDYQVFEASDTFTVPSGVHKVNCAVVGGGGVTANGMEAIGGGGGAGGGGVGYSKDIQVTPSENITLTVGGPGSSTIVSAASAVIEAGAGASTGGEIPISLVGLTPGYFQHYPSRTAAGASAGTTVFFRGCSAGGAGAYGQETLARYNRTSGYKPYGEPADGRADDYQSDGLTFFSDRPVGAGGGGGASMNPSPMGISIGTIFSYYNNYTNPSPSAPRIDLSYSYYHYSDSAPKGHSGNGVDGKTISMDCGYELTAGGGGGGGGYSVLLSNSNYAPGQVVAGIKGSGSHGVGQNAINYYLQTYSYLVQTGSDPKTGAPIYSNQVTHTLLYNKNTSFCSGVAILEWRKRR